MKIILKLLVLAILLLCSNTSNAQNKKQKAKYICKTAKKLVGTKYLYGGTTPSKGFDCSGFTQYVYKQNNVNIDRTAKKQSKMGKKHKPNKAKKGDLVFFKDKRKINHVGIVISNRKGKLKMIHASSSKGVIVTNIEQSDYWKKRLKFTRRIL